MSAVAKLPRPATLARELFKRRVFSGNPPHAPHRYGWLLRLGGPATAEERAWLKAHGYGHMAQGTWLRVDRIKEGT